jgi:hypothetical protein
MEGGVGNVDLIAPPVAHFSVDVLVVEDLFFLFW